MKNFLKIGWMGVLGGCVSSNVVSTGAFLPSAAKETETEEVHMTIKHHCKKGWCSSATLNLNNKTNQNIKVIISRSRIARAGVSLPLAQAGGEGSKPVMLLAGQNKEITLYPYDPSSKNWMRYFKPDSVWCSVRVHEKTPKNHKGNEKCAGLAMYYWEAYKNTKGWISLALAYESPQWGDLVFIQTKDPEFFEEGPSVNLVGNSSAPSWESDSSENILMMVSCNERGVCDTVGKVPSFIGDHGFRP